MKKLFLGILIGIVGSILVACTDESKQEKLVVGATHVPHAVILEKAKPILATQGIDLVIETYTDAILPNKDLDSGDLDANFFQHVPYLEAQNSDFGYDFVSAGEVHIEPIGVYSKKYNSLNTLPEGATILISNSVISLGRMLSLLEAEGIIKLKEDVIKTKAELSDIIENPKNINFDANTAPEMLPQMFKNNEGDAVLINSNFAMDNGLNPLKDTIARESAEKSAYANIIVVKAEDENSEKIKALVKVLRSKEIQNFILEEWEGAVIPVTKEF